jgi:hypothetical protein
VVDIATAKLNADLDDRRQQRCETIRAVCYRADLRITNGESFLTMSETPGVTEMPSDTVDDALSLGLPPLVEEINGADRTM